MTRSYKKTTLARLLKYGIIGSVCCLVLLWILMFYTKGLQPFLTVPLEWGMEWLKTTFGIVLIEREHATAVFFWISVYFCVIGFILGCTVHLVFRVCTLYSISDDGKAN